MIQERRHRTNILPTNPSLTSERSLLRLSSSSLPTGETSPNEGRNNNKESEGGGGGGGGGSDGSSPSPKQPTEQPASPEFRSTLRKNSILRQNVHSVRLKAALDKVTAENEDTYALDDFRIGLKKYLSNSLFGKIYQNVILLTGIVAAIEYIHSTYANDAHNLYLHESSVLDALDMLFAIIFGFDWLLNYFLADNKFYYFWSFFSWVDILIIISTFASRHQQFPWLHNVNTFYSGMMYSFFAIRPVKILRSLRVYVKFMGIVDAVDRYIAEVGLFAGVFILFFASIMQVLERHAQPLPFHTWMYFLFVTIATVGYGDITPHTAAGRVATICIIISAVISVPMATSQLLQKMKLQSIYMRAFYTPKTRNARHVVICGDLSSTDLSDLFAELFHEDHENTDLHAVILLPHAPSVDLILLMQRKEYVFSLSYLEGSALLDHDLRRAKAETASAIFIMTNKFAPNPDEEDAKSILLNLSIKRYISSFYRAKMFYCLQLLRPENKRHLTRSNTNEIDRFDLVVCLNEIKMGTMAQAVVCPGANTLLMNLLTSFADDNHMELEEEKELSHPTHATENTGTEKSTSKKIDNDESPDEHLNLNDVVHLSKDWFDEYQKGCGWEIYLTRLSTVFCGMKFSELSYALYERKGIVLFALQLTDRHCPAAQRMILNPGQYIIPPYEDYDIEAFVIAKNKASSDLSLETLPAHHNLLGNITNAAAHIIKTSVNSTSMISERRKSSLRDIDKLRTTIAYKNEQSKLEKLGEEDEEDEDSNRMATTVMKKESKWKKLKRSALLERKIKIDSFQEVIHRLEDEHFVKNYYVRAAPVLDMNEVTVKTNVIQEIPHINHHIIILGKGLRNLFDLIRPLRSKHLGAMRYIVILYPYELPIDVWRRIAIFDGIILIRGSPLEDSNLRRAGIFRAETVVVLTDGTSVEGNPKSEANQKTGNIEALVDSDAIFSYQHVRRLNPQTQIVVEIVNQSNISYLGDPHDPPLAEDPKFSPQFAGGSLFTTGLLDSIVCQAYYNPDVIKVVNRLITGIDQVERTQLVLKAAEELGHVPKKENNSSSSSSSGEESDGDGKESEEQLSEQDKFEKRFRKKSQRLSKLPKDLLLHKARKKLLKIPNSCLYQINIPEGMNGDKKTYGAVFQHLAAQGMIPLGIFRGVLPTTRMGPRGNQFPFVYTNPSKDVELFSCDLIFVLSTQIQKKHQKSEITDWLLNLQMQKKSRATASSATGIGGGTIAGEKGKSGIVSSHFTLGSGGTTVTADVAAVLEKTEKNYKKLDEKIKKISTEMEEKLQSVIGSLEHLLATDDISSSTINEMMASMTRSNSRTRFVSSDDASSVVSESSGNDRMRSLSARTENSDMVGTTSANSIDGEYPYSGRTSRSQSIVSVERSLSPSSNLFNTNGNESKSLDEATSSITGGLAPLFPLRKYSSARRRLSNPVAPIQEEPDSNTSTNHSEDEKGSSNSPSPASSSKRNEFPPAEGTSPLKERRTAFIRTSSNNGIPPARLDHAVSAISMDFSTNDDDDEEDEEEEIETEHLNDRQHPINPSNQISSSSGAVSSRIESPSNLIFTVRSEDGMTTGRDEHTVDEELEELKNVEYPRDIHRPEKVPSTQNFMPSDELPVEQQQRLQQMQDLEESNSVRTFRSLTSLETAPRLPGPRITDIAPLPLDRLQRAIPYPGSSMNYTGIAYIGNINYHPNQQQTFNSVVQNQQFSDSYDTRRKSSASTAISTIPVSPHSILQVSPTAITKHYSSDGRLNNTSHENQS